MMAALGGIVLASRLRSVDTGAGGGSILLYAIAAPVIGGTSLFRRAREHQARVGRQSVKAGGRRRNRSQLAPVRPHPEPRRTA